MKGFFGGNKKVLLLFYILAAYICLQFFWWAYLLINLNRDLYETGALGTGKQALNMKIWMVLGEGTVFFLFLFVGLRIMQRSISKELTLAKRQRNFLLSITHEFKTPLASIKLYLQTLIKRKNLAGEKRQEIYESAIADTDRLNSLIENILVATRIENNQNTLSKQNINLSQTVEEVIKSVVDTLGKDHFTICNIQKNIILNADPMAIHSILVNLYENATKYSPRQSKIEVDLQEKGKTVILSVADNGKGIPQNELPNIFMKFYRIGNEETRSNKGTGLGLFIVQDLTEQHNGKIFVEANEPVGSIFKIVFRKLT